VGAVMTLAMGYVNATQAQTRVSMERGENLVARWTLDAALWQDFVLPAMLRYHFHRLTLLTQADPILSSRSPGLPLGQGDQHDGAETNPAVHCCST